MTSLNELVKETETTIDDALEFFVRQGVPVTRRPVAHYLFDINPQGYIARVPHEEDLDRYLERAFTDSMYEMMLHQIYGLHLSPLALTEMKNLGKSMDLQPLARLDKTPVKDDITFYEGFAQAHYDRRRHTVAHEVWHTIEKELELLDTTKLIHEGTAECAAYAFMGKRPRRPSNKLTQTNICYNIGGFIAYQYLTQGHPFVAILDPSHRKIIQDHFTERALIPSMEALALDICEKQPAVKEMVFREMEKIPAFARIRGNVTAQTLVNAHHEAGAPNAAAELALQDLSKMVALYHKIGY